MRLPLSHPPPEQDAPGARCAYLEALAEAATGLSLRGAAALLSSGSSRGRHGNALQWHLGLESHDGQARLDWENRIEIKLATVWRTSSGAVTSDKMKVCDLGVDPWRKLSNVLFVFADRVSRVVVGYRFWRLGGRGRERLARSWSQDPHFGRPDLFVEAREQGERMAPAYYVSSRWLRQEGLQPDLPGVLAFDAKTWGLTRLGGRDPLVTVASVTASNSGRLGCPRCRGRLHYDPSRLAELGWSAATHAMPMDGECAIRGQVVVAEARIAAPSGPFSRAEQLHAIEGVGPVVRLSDRVAEPDDHLH